MKPHRASTVLVLGILSLIVCAPLGIIAWIMGNNDLREMNAGLMDPSGRDSTSAGRICGMIGSILLIVALVVMLLAFFVFGAIGIAGASSVREEMQHSAPIGLPSN